jgi:hypothetical protein
MKYYFMPPIHRGDLLHLSRQPITCPYLKLTIHNPSFATTPLSPGKIKKAPPKLTNFTYTELDRIDRNP